MNNVLPNAKHGTFDLSSLTIFTDPGHGWLEVPIMLLRELGIADKISSCSYRNGNMAYLEEDCDLSIFIRAIGTDKWKLIKDCLGNDHTDSQSAIRRFRPYYS